MMTVKEIISLTNGRLIHGDLKQKSSGVSTDSRTIKKNNLFIALKGKRFDGHKFLLSVARKNIKVVLVSKKPEKKYSNISVILVKDTSFALQDLARSHRENFQIPVIAITGSCGKTTTKELIASVLSKKLCVLKNFSTENNFIGVSKTILELKSKHDVLILEFGTNHFGEIKNLVNIANPTICVLTNVGKSHLEFLKTSAGVFKEKKGIYANLEKSGTIIFNRDDEFLSKIFKEKTLAQKLTFSINQKSNIQALKIQRMPKGIHFFVGKQKFFVNSFSYSGVYNALCAISVGTLFNFPKKTMALALLKARLPGQRQSLCFTKKKFWIIDDSYNANPLSVKFALESLCYLPTKRKRIFVFGGMGELGRSSSQAHKDIGHLIDKNKVDYFITIGKNARLAIKAVGQRHISTLSFDSCKPALTFLKSFVCAGDSVLIKGSRSFHLEEIVSQLKK